jgi:hypothetical protein
MAVFKKVVRNIQFQPKNSVSDLLDFDTGSLANKQGLAWSTTEEDLVPGALIGLPEDLTFSYNGDKTVASIVGADTNTVFTYNGDKTVNTIDDGFQLKTFAYNANKTVNTITIT